MSSASSLIPATPQRSQAGVAMIEALVSVVMLALGVLALIGLQAAMNANVTESKYRAEASYLANELVGQMWVDQINLTKYAVASGACTATYGSCTDWLTKVGKRLPAGSATVAINGVEVTITVTWQTPGTGMPHSFLLMANVVS